MPTKLSNVGAVIQKLAVDLPAYSAINGISLPPVPDTAFNAHPNSAWITVQEIDSKNNQVLSGSSGLGPSIMQINVFCFDYEYGWTARRGINTIFENLSGTISVISGASAILQGGNHMGNHELYHGDIKKYQLITRWRLFFEF